MSDPTLNPDQISLDDDEEDEDPEAALAATMGFSGFGAAKRRRLNSPSSSTRTRPTGTGANEVQLGVRPSKSTEATTAQQGGGKARKANLAGGGLAAFLAHGKGLPSRPPEPVQQERAQEDQGAMRGGDGGGEDWRHGVRNERGDVAYFLPSFLEDPWKGLS